MAASSKEGATPFGWSAVTVNSPVTLKFSRPRYTSTSRTTAEWFLYCVARIFSLYCMPSSSSGGTFLQIYPHFRLSLPSVISAASPQTQQYKNTLPQGQQLGSEVFPHSTRKLLLKIGEKVAKNRNNASVGSRDSASIAEYFVLLFHPASLY